MVGRYTRIAGCVGFGAVIGEREARDCLGLLGFEVKSDEQRRALGRGRL